MTVRSCFIVLCSTSLSLAGERGVTVSGQQVTLTTPTVTVQFDGANLTSIRSTDGTEFLHGTQRPTHPVELWYYNDESLGQDKHEKITTTRLSPLAARIVVEGENARRSLLVSIDPATNDILVTPDGLSFRRGVRSVGWKLAFHGETELFLPLINGMRVRTGWPQPSKRAFFVAV
jgi:hypothetical protein